MTSWKKYVIELLSLKGKLCKVELVVEDLKKELLKDRKTDQDKGEKYVNCGKCEETFQRKSYLKVHIKTLHEFNLNVNNVKNYLTRM